MADEKQIDLENRDPNQMYGYMTVDFEEIFAEPDGTHSIDCVWTNSYKCFTCGKNLCYKILTLLCGIFVALCWGCEFAGIAFTHIWCYTPDYKACEINLGVAKKFYGTCIHCICDPMCEACSLFFSAFKKG